MEIQLDMILLFNTVCIALLTFYLLFKFRRDFIKLQEDIQEIKFMVSLELKDKIIISDNIEFDLGHANDND